MVKGIVTITMNAKGIFNVFIIKVNVLDLTPKLMFVLYPPVIKDVLGRQPIVTTVVNVSMGKGIVLRILIVKKEFVSYILALFLVLHPMSMSA